MISTLVFAAALSSDAFATVNCKKWPARCDTDLDGLNNLLETQLGTSVTDSDTDDDGLLDGAEHTTHLTSPTLADTDADGWTDGYEVLTSLTSALDADSDGDTVLDPVDAAPLVFDDLDADGVADALDADADGNGVDDDVQLVGGSSLAEVAVGLVMDVEVCPWSLQGDPTCEWFAVELQPSGVMLETTALVTGEYQEPLSALGAWGLLAAFPTLDTASLRMRGAQVDPGGAVACYEGAVDALGGWYNASTGESGSYWFETGHFSSCVW